MAFRALGGVRVGVLISLTITGLLLWLAQTAWWSERTDVGGFRDVEVGLTGFGGSPFVWCAAGACIAFVVSALPLRPRVRRAATGAGLAATAAAAIVWAVLVARVLRRDAEAYRGWASEVWARRLADPATDRHYNGFHHYYEPVRRPTRQRYSIPHGSRRSEHSLSPPQQRG